jgi:hypothetical protein
MNAPFDAAAVAEEAVRRAAEPPTDDEFIVELPPNFTVSKGGVFHHTVKPVSGRPDKGGDTTTIAEWVCAPLYVTAETRDEADDCWGLLLEWKDRDGNNQATIISGQCRGSLCMKAATRSQRSSSMQG